MFDKSSEKKLTQDSQKNPSPQRKKKSCRIPMKKKKSIDPQNPKEIQK